MSLERQPIMVCTNLDGIIAMPPQDASFTWKTGGWDDLIMIIDGRGTKIEMTRQGAEDDHAPNNQLLTY